MSAQVDIPVVLSDYRLVRDSGFSPAFPSRSQRVPLTDSSRWAGVGAILEEEAGSAREE